MRVGNKLTKRIEFKNQNNHTLSTFKKKLQIFISNYGKAKKDLSLATPIQKTAK